MTWFGTQARQQTKQRGCPELTSIDLLDVRVYFHAERETIMNNNDLWHKYLSENGFSGYDGLCQCYSCAEVRAGFQQWKEQKIKNTDSDVTNKKDI